MKKIAFLLLLLLAGPVRAGDEGAPGREATVGRVVERFLDLNRRERLDRGEARRLFAGEMADWDRPTAGPLSGPDRIVFTDEGLAVARLRAQAPDRDVYLYLRPMEQAWRITMMRSLAMTGMLHQIRAHLSGLAERSSEDEDRLRHLDLTLSTDRQLIDWFGANRAQLEALRAQADAQRPKEGRQPAYQPVESARVAPMLARLGLSSLRIEGERTVIAIGGMLDNVVGVLHTKGAPPRFGIDGGEQYIWVEPLGDGWFLFRTT